MSRITTAVGLVGVLIDLTLYKISAVPSLLNKLDSSESRGYNSAAFLIHHPDRYHLQQHLHQPFRLRLHSFQRPAAPFAPARWHAPQQEGSLHRARAAHAHAA